MPVESPRPDHDCLLRECRHGLVEVLDDDRETVLWTRLTPNLSVPLTREEQEWEG